MYIVVYCANLHKDRLEMIVRCCANGGLGLVLRHMTQEGHLAPKTVGIVGKC